MKGFQHHLVSIYNKIPSKIKNRYTLTILFFCLWMSFFDSNSFGTQYKFWKQWRNLEREKAYYKQAITEVEQNREELLNDAEKKEKFAREKYHMKRHNEDLFIIVED